jgi:hypothetical protein
MYDDDDDDDDVDDDDDDDVPSKPNKKKTNKGKRKKKKKMKFVEGSEEEKVTSTKLKSTGTKKKKKSKKKKYPPSVLKPNRSCESISVLSDGLGANYPESENVGIGAVSEEDRGWWDHLRVAACLEDEKTQKMKTLSTQPEETAGDSLESDNADMVLDHLHLLLDRLLDNEEYDINKWERKV